MVEHVGDVVEAGEVRVADDIRPLAGNHPSVVENSRISSMPSQNSGIE